MYVGFGSYGQDADTSTPNYWVPVALLGGLVLIAMLASRGDVDQCERLWKQYKRAATSDDKYLADFALSTAKYEGCGWTQLPKG